VSGALRVHALAELGAQASQECGSQEEARSGRPCEAIPPVLSRQLDFLVDEEAAPHAARDVTQSKHSQICAQVDIEARTSKKTNIHLQNTFYQTVDCLENRKKRNVAFTTK